MARDFLHAAEHNGCINDHYLRELFAKYGMPVHYVSDNGPQFRSEEFTRFLEMNGVKHVRVAAYHAASNGLAERMVQSFKNHMKACEAANCQFSTELKTSR